MILKHEETWKGHLFAYLSLFKASNEPEYEILNRAYKYTE
jgi:hypothetical protein